jgi:hypothetical protein
MTTGKAGGLLGDRLKSAENPEPPEAAELIFPL